MLACVDGQLHCGHPELGRLAGAVADNRFRRQLRARLHGTDTRAAAQALRVLPHVRHPGLTPDDHRVAQRLLLHEVATVTCLLAPHRRAARLLWTREWAEELQETTRHHGPDRTAAKQLLALFRRRPGP